MDIGALRQTEEANRILSNLANDVAVSDGVRAEAACGLTEFGEKEEARR